MLDAGLEELLDAEDAVDDAEKEVAALLQNAKHPCTATSFGMPR